MVVVEEVVEVDKEEKEENVVAVEEVVEVDKEKEENVVEVEE